MKVCLFVHISVCLNFKFGNFFGTYKIFLKFVHTFSKHSRYFWNVQAVPAGTFWKDVEISNIQGLDEFYICILIFNDFISLVLIIIYFMSYGINKKSKMKLEDKYDGIKVIRLKFEQI